MGNDIRLTVSGPRTFGTPGGDMIHSVEEIDNNQLRPRTVEQMIDLYLDYYEKVHHIDTYGNEFRPTDDRSPKDSDDFVILEKLYLDWERKIYDMLQIESHSVDISQEDMDLIMQSLLAELMEFANSPETYDGEKKKFLRDFFSLHGPIDLRLDISEV